MKESIALGVIDNQHKTTEIIVQKPRVLFLSSTDGAHTGRSGYTILSEYIDNSTILEALRKPAKNYISRLSDALAARVSLTRWSRRSSLTMELKALKLFKQQKVDIVHYLWGDRDISFMDFFKRREKIKLVISLHNCASMLDETFNFPKRFRQFDALILMSNVQRPYFEKAGISPEKIHVVLHGIDCDHFKPKPAIKSEEFTVLTVGSWQRNFKQLSEICKQLSGQSSLKINIISSDKFKYMFEDQKNVIFQSRLSNEDLLIAYQSASCFLMTAEDATANNALLEALACGLPIVTERVGGIPEYVNDECALFCNDVQSFVDKIISISSSNDLHAKMSSAARQRALELDWKQSAKTINKIYASL